jgi:putative membrane protein
MAGQWGSSESGARAAAITTAIALVAYAALHVKAVALDQTRPSLIIASLVFTILGLAHATYALGWRRALTFFALCTVISGLLEQIAIWTADVGSYYYTDVLGPKIGDVPIVIPISWFMMIYPCYTIANLLVDGRPVATARRLLPLLWLSMVTAVVETAWDLSLDPFMTGKMKAWVWADGGPYFGIPFQNYFGWVQVTLIVMVIYRLCERRIPLRPLGPLSRRMAMVPLVVYALNGLTDVLAGYPEATRLLPPFVMGIPLLLAANRLWAWAAQNEAGRAASTGPAARKVTA